MGEKMGIWEQIRLLNAWAPLLGYGQRYLAEQDIHRRSLVIGDAAEWLAGKTTSKLDDEFVDRVVAILKTAEGEAMVRFLVGQVETVVAAEGQP